VTEEVKTRLKAEFKVNFSKEYQRVLRERKELRKQHKNMEKIVKRMEKEERKRIKLERRELELKQRREAVEREEEERKRVRLEARRERRERRQHGWIALLTELAEEDAIDELEESYDEEADKNQMVLGKNYYSGNQYPGNQYPGTRTERGALLFPRNAAGIGITNSSNAVRNTNSKGNSNTNSKGNLGNSNNANAGGRNRDGNKSVNYPNCDDDFVTADEGRNGSVFRDEGGNGGAFRDQSSTYNPYAASSDARGNRLRNDRGGNIHIAESTANNNINVGNGLDPKRKQGVLRKILSELYMQIGFGFKMAESLALSIKNPPLKRILEVGKSETI
jgi:hypothetical protein